MKSAGSVRNALRKLFSFAGVYYAAIASLVALLALVVGKTLVSPSCSVITAHDCIVDGWAVAGLASAVLGVGGTILAVLGAVAVAAWWTGLDEKVDTRVDTRIDDQMKIRVEQNLEAHKHEVHEQTEKLLYEQKLIFDKQSALMQQTIDTLQEKTNQLERRLGWIREMALTGIIQQDPWRLDEWAQSFLLFHDSKSDIALLMLRKYLQIVDYLFDSEKSEMLRKRLECVEYPNATNPLWHWYKAHDWLREVKQQGIKDNIEEAQKEIDKRQSQIEQWKKQRGDL